MTICRYFVPLAAAVVPALAMAATSLEVIIFAGGWNWPLWAGIEKGFFTANGVEVKITPTPNSAFQIQNLVAGKFDIASTAIDNVIAYDEGQGEAKLERPADLVAIMGGQTGGLRLVVQPDVRSFADLKGKSLAVDAATTGYAFVLRKMLQQAGLSESDYQFERMGGTAQRVEALMQKRALGTIAAAPFDQAPLAQGYRALADVSSIGPYQSTLFAVRREWARTHEAELVGFIRSVRAAIAWLADPAHRDEAIAIYRKYMPQASEEAGRGAWEELLGRDSEGIRKDGRVDVDGVRTVLKLRSEFGRPQKELTDPSKYIDESYYIKATSRP
jgi:ABC-type nitrate/sulfonate/bicarbonate transport system substrate-binding protein